MSISPQNFSLNPGLTKNVDNREGAGLGPSNAPAFTPTTPVGTFNVSVQEGPSVSEVRKTFTGPNSGTGGGSSILTRPDDTYGWTSPSGSRVNITGGSGSETIEIVQSSGASIMIDADGAIFLQPTGRKGFGLNASAGDGVVAAQQRIVIKGNSGITLETEGNLEFNVGKDVLMDVGGDFSLTVKGGTYVQSDGTVSVEAVRDFVRTVGGTDRLTIAGDQRTQVVGEMRFDVGENFETRTDQDHIAYAQKSIFLNSKESSSWDVSTGQLRLLSKDDFTIGSEASAYMQAETDITLEGGSTVSARSGGNMVLSSRSSLYADAEGAIEQRATSHTTDVSGPYLMRSTSATFSTTGTMDLLASGATKLHSASTVDVKGSSIGLNNPGSATAPVAPLPQETTKPRAASTAMSPPAAEYPDAETLLDSMTSEREAPEFPENSKKLSEDEMSLYENEGDEPDAAAYNRARGNKGAGSPFSMGNDFGTLDDSGNIGYDGSNNKARSQASGYPLPSSLNNSNEKISRHVTVGMFGNLHRCPPQQMGLSRAEILQNVAHLCANILDPVIAKFGSKVQLNSGGAGLRIGRGGSRHYLGKAHDIRASSGNHAETAEIAKWIVENLPYDRVFLEANASGTIHIHVEAAPQGEQGDRTVWTCADPKCRNRTDGLKLAYAKQGLLRMGFRA